MRVWKQARRSPRKNGYLNGDLINVQCDETVY